MQTYLHNWQILPAEEPPQWLIERAGRYGAQLLWQRGWRSPEAVEGFLNPDLYTPASAFEFGEEMDLAVQRIQQAYLLEQKVVIWGDFDADGITSTAVLWEGLGQFFSQNDRLTYYIPNRLSESHGLSKQGIESLTECHLIITCDTGSTNIAEIEYANTRGIDVIVTDHHTLPQSRPPVCAIINPRFLETSHPLHYLSGVAVAFKLIEALYETMPEVPQQPLEQLLDLVAIGLVADLVQLSGDCRYLAQKGIAVLKEKQRLGVKFLLSECKKAGDRATDISFGLAPRINSVSRMWGDVRRCVELLTSQNPKVCQDLTNLAELANTERKALQKKIYAQVKAKIDQIDLSTTGVLVLDDAQWPVGILGLVAGQIASEYGRPTILCNIEDGVARGSARSAAGIDLYELIAGQEHLLTHFGGHPLAAGLSLPATNLNLFREAIAQKFWYKHQQVTMPSLQIDAIVTVAELGQELFRQFKQLEPFGMGNPSPQLLIRNCSFEDKRHANIKNPKGQKVEYIRTSFTLCDATGEIKGMWWGHYAYEIPDQICDVIVELIDNTRDRTYEVRLIDLKPVESELITDRLLPVLISGVTKPLTTETSKPVGLPFSANALAPNDVGQLNIYDYRGKPLSLSSHLTTYSRCPASWQDVRQFNEILQMYKAIALTYLPPEQINAVEIWQILVGIAKYLSRTHEVVFLEKLQAKIHIYDMSVIQLGLEALASYGWESKLKDDGSLQIVWQNNLPLEKTATLEQQHISNQPHLLSNTTPALQKFLRATNELLFRQKYFEQQALTPLQPFIIKTF